MKARRFYQVDVFTDRPFAGNPVAVVLDAAGLDSEQMQAIARWTNLSETTFVLPAQQAGADYRLRIFTPGGELPFAGHPTLGSAAALLAAEPSLRQRSQLVQQCGAGLVSIRIDGERLWLTLPQAVASALQPADLQRLARALGLPAVAAATLVDVGPRWITAELADARQVQALAPDMTALASLSGAIGATGVTVFGHHQPPTDGAFEVRSFAPAMGVPEDPVCGSGNGCVASLLAAQGRTTDYLARQGRSIGRDGIVHVHYNGAQIEIGGHSVIVIQGSIQA